MTKTILILEAGLRESREYWLKDLKLLGYKLILAQPWDMTWENQYVDDFYQFDFTNWELAEKIKVASFCIKNSVTGVITLNEGTVPFAQDLSNFLNLPSLAGTNLKFLRNKKMMRDLIKTSNIAQPKFHKVSSDSSLPKDFNFPVIVKPVELMSSLGVKLVNSNFDLKKAIDIAKQIDFNGENLRKHYNLSSDVLIEEYIQGDEYSVETVLQNGKIIDFFITKKYKTVEPYFFEVGHLTNPVIEIELIDQISEFVKEINLLRRKNSSMIHKSTLFETPPKIVYKVKRSSSVDSTLIPLPLKVVSTLPDRTLRRTPISKFRTLDKLNNTESSGTEANVLSIQKLVAQWGDDNLIFTGNHRDIVALKTLRIDFSKWCKLHRHAISTLFVFDAHVIHNIFKQYMSTDQQYIFSVVLK